jgi:hypothetical protein
MELVNMFEKENYPTVFTNVSIAELEKRLSKSVTGDAK